MVTVVAVTNHYKNMGMSQKQISAFSLKAQRAQSQAANVPPLPEKCL